MESQTQRDDRYDLHESIINVAIWVITLAGVVLWAAPFLMIDYPEACLLIPLYLVINIYIVDLILMWGTSVHRLKGVVDRRVVLGMIAAAFIFRIASNDLLLNELSSTKVYVVLFVLSGFVLGGAVCLLFLLAIKGKNWHLVDCVKDKQYLGDWVGEAAEQDFVSSLYAYPCRVAGLPNSLWRVCFACIVAVVINVVIYASDSFFIVVALIVVLFNFLGFLLKMSFSSSIDANRIRNK